MLEARLLGRFEIRVDGTAVQLASRPAQSLFAYLLLNSGTAHRRERLAGLLWPESAEESARSNLRHALWRIRKSLEAAGSAECLLADELSIGFDTRTPHRIDVATLQAERKGDETAESLRERVAAYGGELLPGFYDEWVILERERLKGTFERAMQQLLDQLVRDERWSEVAERAETWIAVGQSPEPAFRALMLAGAGQGDAAGVASAYRRCAAALRNDLGVEPSPQTRVLYERLTKGEPAVGAAPQAPAPQATEDPASASAREAAPAPGKPPYQGLRHFDGADSERFFGREELIARVAARVREQRFVAVIGASGSGKSSLVRAGVVPAIGAEAGREHRVHLLTPTARPLESLAIALTRGAAVPGETASVADAFAREARALRLALATTSGPNADVLLVVDQFEELFTECDAEAERRAFIDNLLAATGEQGPASLVLTLRADFYAECARYPALRELLAAHQEYIGPMTAPELRRAIEEPARVGDWAFEPGLVDLILRDVGDEPGALPLLSHALLETWERRSGRAMTLRSYAESGGVQGAIARTAETVYNQRLDAGERDIARLIFLRLAAFGEGSQSTRRRVSIRELTQSPKTRPVVERVLRILADARLVTVSVETVEVAHEALFSEWPALRQWLSEDRDGLRIHRHLTLAAQEWDATGRESGDLYRGARLGQAQEWAATRARDLNPLEREFLEASVHASQRAIAEREERQRNDLAAARQRTLILAGAFVVALVLAGVALFFGEQARLSALAAQAIGRITFSRELAAASSNQLAIDPERSVLLALEAVAATYPFDGKVTAEAESALHRAVGATRLELRLVGHGVDSTGTGTVWSVAFSPDGKRIATGGIDGTARVWDAVTGSELMKLELAGPSNPGDEVLAVAFSPDGKIIATASGIFAGRPPGAPRLWDAVSGREVRRLGDHVDAAGEVRDVNGIAFSPDGALVATASSDRTARIWETATGRLLLTLRGHTATVRSVAFSPDGKRVLTAGDRTARVWDVASGAEALVLSGHQGPVNRAAYSPDGTRIVTASNDLTARLWDARDGRELLALASHRAQVRAVALSPDGRRVVTSSSAGDLTVWDATTGREQVRLAGTSVGVLAVAFSPDGSRVVSVGGDGIGRVWRVGPERELLTISATGARTPIGVRPAAGEPVGGGVNMVAFDRAGERLAGALTDGSARIWDPRSGQELLKLLGHRDEVYRIAWSPDGARLATASRDLTARIWDARSGHEILTLVGHGRTVTPGERTDGVLGVSFSSDGARIATAGNDGTARVWDATTGRELWAVTAGAAPDRNQLWSLIGVAFSPDGSRLVTLGVDEAAPVKLWDIATGQHLRTFLANERVFSAVFSADGSRLITAGHHGRLGVWDVATGARVFAIPAHTGSAQAVDLSRDGALLASSGNVDGHVRLWRANNGASVLELGDGRARFTGVTLSPDASIVAASAEDGTVRLYVTRIDDLVVLARARLTRSLTQDECRVFLHREACP